MDLFLVLERIMGVYYQCPESETGLVEHDLRRETETQISAKIGVLI